jgi:hypothetical protein
MAGAPPGGLGLIIGPPGGLTPIGGLGPGIPIGGRGPAGYATCYIVFCGVS